MVVFIVSGDFKHYMISRRRKQLTHRLHRRGLVSGLRAHLADKILLPSPRRIQVPGWRTRSFWLAADYLSGRKVSRARVMPLYWLDAKTDVMRKERYPRSLLPLGGLLECSNLPT